MEFGHLCTPSAAQGDLADLTLAQRDQRNLGSYEEGAEEDEE